MILQYKSAFIGTVLVIEVTDKQIIAKSNNISVITIVKDQLNNDATARKISLDVQSEIDIESVYFILDILHPMVQRQYEIAKKFQLIEGLKELVMSEQDQSFLSVEYRGILKDCEKIKKDYEY